MGSNPYQPPAVPAAETRTPPRNLGGLTAAITIVFSLVAISLVTVAITNQALLHRHPGAGMSGNQDLVGDDPFFFLLQLSALGVRLSTIAGMVLFCIWVYRANVNAAVLVSSGLDFTPGWAVGWFFVPFANLFKPYHAVAEIYRASHPDADPYYWRTASLPGQIPLWWTSWITYNVLSSWSRRLRGPPSPGLFLFAAGLGTLAAVLLIDVTRRIHRLQRMKARRVRTDVQGEMRTVTNSVSNPFF